MKEAFFSTIERYHFKDDHGHPIEQCHDVLKFFDELNLCLDTLEAETDKAPLIS